jgi:hypothetical protein
MLFQSDIEMRAFCGQFYDAPCSPVRPVCGPAHIFAGAQVRHQSTCDCRTEPRYPSQRPPESICHLFSGGAKGSFPTTTRENKANPIWNESVVFESEGSPSNDLFRFSIRSAPSTLIISVGELFVREILFRIPSTREILLVARANGAHPRSAGSIFVKFLVHRPGQADDLGWQLRPLDLDLLFLAAPDLPQVRGGIVITAQLENCQNEQHFRSKSDALAWQHRQSFALSNFKENVIFVTIVDDDSERPIGTVRIPGRDFRLEQGPRTKKYDIKPAPGVQQCGQFEVQDTIIALEQPRPSFIKIPSIEVPAGRGGGTEIG